MPTRFVFTSDTHFAFSPSMFPEGDVFIHAGDLQMEGSAAEWYSRLESLAALQYNYKYFCPGNHDLHVMHYDGLTEAELAGYNIKLIGTTNPVVNIAGYRVLALPYVTNLKGWAYNVEEEWVSNYLIALNAEPDIVVSHAPMYRVLDAIEPQQRRHKDRVHVGCRAYKKWYNGLETKPKLWVSGHIHESYGRLNTGSTEFMNVSMCNADYIQTNPPIAIDL